MTNETKEQVNGSSDHGGATTDRRAAPAGRGNTRAARAVQATPPSTAGSETAPFVALGEPAEPQFLVLSGPQADIAKMTMDGLAPREGNNYLLKCVKVDTADGFGHYAFKLVRTYAGG